MKTKTTNKYILILVLTLAFISSMILGVLNHKSVNAENEQASISYDYFKCFQGSGADFGTGLTYGEANVLYGGRPGTTLGTIDALKIEFRNSLKSLPYPMGGRLVFAKPIDLSKTDNIITLGFISSAEAGYDHGKFNNDEFNITLTDAQDSEKFVTFNAKFADSDGYRTKVLGSGISGEIAGTYMSAYGCTLKTIELTDDGVLQFKHILYENNEFAVSADPAIPILNLTEKGWTGFVGNEVYLSISVPDGCELAVLSIGGYDLTDPESEAYDKVVPAEITDLPHCYDYFTVGGGKVVYDTARIIYGARPSKYYDYKNCLIADFNSEGSLTFTKEVDLSQTDNLITLAQIDNEAADYGHATFNNTSYTVTVYDVTNPEKYIELTATFVSSDHFNVSAKHSGMSEAITVGTADGGIANSGCNIFGWVLDDENNLLVNRYTYDGFNFAKGAEAESISSGGKTIDLTTASPAFEGFGGSKVIVSVSVAQASELAILSIGEYDLTDVESAAYDEAPIETPESYDLFSVDNGTATYDKANVIYGPRTGEGVSPSAPIRTLVIDLDGEDSAFRFDCAIDLSKTDNLITLAMIDNTTPEYNHSHFNDYSYTITVTDAQDSNRYFSFRETFKHSDGFMGNEIEYNGSNGMQVLNIGNYPRNSGSNFFGWKFSENVMGNSSTVYENNKFNDGSAIEHPVFDFTTANPAWNGFSGNKVYVSVTVSQKLQLAIKSIGEYDLTDVNGVAYSQAFDVTFKADESTVLQTVKTLKGKIPEYTGATPAVEEEGYIFEFEGWNKEIVAATENATYIAKFTKTAIEYKAKVTVYGVQAKEVKYTIENRSEKLSEIKNMMTADTVEYVYANNLPEVLPLKDCEITETRTVRQYTVTWKNADGTILKTDKVEYGKIPTYTGKTPEKAETDEATYTFKGWDKEIVAVTSDVEYIAAYSENAKSTGGCNSNLSSSGYMFFIALAAIAIVGKKALLRREK